MKLKFTHKSLLLCLTVYAVNFYLGFAQQTAAFPEYNYNPFIINPGYTGLLSTGEVTISNTGFSSFDGAPRNFNASLHVPISNGKMGLGGAIIRDEIGVTSSTNTFLAYSYKIRFDFKNDRPYWQNYELGVLSFGITAGLLQYQDNLLELNIVDDIKFSENINSSIPTIGAGFLFNHSRFYVGLSAPNVLGTSLAQDGDSINLVFPVYGYLGYRFFNDRFKNFMFKPSIFIKHEKGAPILADFNASISYQNKVEIGAGYRTNSSFNMLAGLYLLNNFRVIYHYNIATNNSPIGNIHGLVLSVRFGNGYAL